MAAPLPLVDPATGAPVHRPRNLDWRRAAALLYGDWGTSKAYVIGMGFFAAQFSSIWIILAVSVLTGLVGWMYSIVCRLFPDGGGVYSAARLQSRALASLGALLLLAGFTVTASLSGYFGVIYLGVPQKYAAVVTMAVIAVLGFLNRFGPRHSGSLAAGLAIPAVISVIAVLLMAAPHFTLSHVERPHESFSHLWIHFVGVILALSGVEAIANMTGVMPLNPGSTPDKPVITRTANRALLVVAIEVVVGTTLLAFAMHSLPNTPEMTKALTEHKDDMIKFLADTYGAMNFGPAAGSVVGWTVGIIFALLLLSAVNTAIVAVIGLLYLMGQDGEMPPQTTRLNSHGVPTWPLVAATALPIIVLVVASDGEALAELYAIGVVGAIAVNLGACTMNRRLPMKMWERGAMGLVFLVLAAVEITLAKTKPNALFFALCVIGVGFALRQYSHRLSGLKTLTVPTALADVVTPAAVAEMRRPAIEDARLMVAARGLTPVLRFAMEEAVLRKAVLYCVYIKEVAFLPMGRLATSTGAVIPRKARWQDDPQAKAIMEFMLNLAQEREVSLIPVYAVSDDAAETILDLAATCAADYVLLGAPQRQYLTKLLRGNVVTEVASKLPENISLIIHG